MTKQFWTRALVVAGIIAAPALHVQDVDAARRGAREVTIPAGTTLRLTLDTSHNSETSREEDLVQARLASPIVVNGRTVVPAASLVTGHVTEARPSEKVKGRAFLAVRFSELRPARDNERYSITTRTWAREAKGTKGKDAVKIGVPAGVGAVVGGVLGGKKGAAIGAGVGAGAGAGVVLATDGREVSLPRGSTLIVRLSRPLTVRV